MSSDTSDRVITSNLPITLKIAIVARSLSTPLLVAIDSSAILTVIIASFYLRDSLFRSIFPTIFPEKLLADTLSHIWWFPIVLIICLSYENLYQKRLPYWKEVELILKAITLAVIFVVIILYLSKTAVEVSRALIGLIWLMLAFVLPLFRYAGKLLLTRIGVYKRPVLIIGAGKTACLLANALRREKTMGYEAVGILNDRGECAEVFTEAPASDIPILGKVEQAEYLIRKTRVQDIFIAMPALSAGETVKLVNRLQPLVSNVVLIPDLFGLSMSGIEAECFFEEQVLMLNIKNRLKPVFNRAIKRLFDLMLGSILFLLFTPLLFAISILIKLDSKGPVFYNGYRLGQRGKIFECHKYRTMYDDSAEIHKNYLANNSEAQKEWAKYRKLKGHDPRLTRVGKVLRRFSLDELPQLINVLTGEMSLVGPRPYLPSEKEAMEDWSEDILVAKPGITGLWQVSGRNLIDFDGRLKLGAWYVKNWSLWLDLIILLKTFRVVIKGEGAY